MSLTALETVIDFSAADVYPNTGSLGKVIGDKDYAAWRYSFVANELNYADVTGWGA